MQNVWRAALLLQEIAGGARNPVNMDISPFPQRIRALITVGGDSLSGNHGNPYAASGPQLTTRLPCAGFSFHS
jgi:hypothetical protein